MYHYELTETGFRIYREGVLFIDAPYKPGVEGYQAMTPEEATAIAQAYIAEFEAAEQARAAAAADGGTQ